MSKITKFFDGYFDYIVYEDKKNDKPEILTKGYEKIEKKDFYEYFGKKIVIYKRMDNKKFTFCNVFDDNEGTYDAQFFEFHGKFITEIFKMNSEVILYFHN